MKKSMMLVFAAVLVAIMAGCGGGSSSASKKAAVKNTTPATETAFDVNPITSGGNVTYKTTDAKGSFPPAPPSSELATAQEAANAKAKKL